MAPALVGAGEEAREESRAKKLAASSTADWVEVACTAILRGSEGFRIRERW